MGIELCGKHFNVKAPYTCYICLYEEREKLKTEIEILKGIQVGCEGRHRHAVGPLGHAHGHGTMWYEGDPSKYHHHHDEKCILAYKREIARLRKLSHKVYEKWKDIPVGDLNIDKAGEFLDDMWEAISNMEVKT